MSGLMCYFAGLLDGVVVTVAVVVLKRVFVRKAKVLNGPVEARQIDYFDRTAERHVRMLFGGKL